MAHPPTLVHAQIRVVVDRLVERVSLLMTEPDEIERQKMVGYPWMVGRLTNGPDVDSKVLASV